MNGVLGAGFGRPSIGKAVKVALGCSLAVLLARAMDLSTATAVVTITLLSVQRTKKDTLRAALRRCLAFLSALALALPLFFLLRFSVLSLGLFLLLFVPICQWLNIEEGLAMSTVLMLHVWNARTITAALVLNETILMAIGILMGIVMNLYMPRRTRAIREDQRITEERMRAILRDMGTFLREDSDPPEVDIPHRPPLDLQPDPIPEHVPSRRKTSSRSGEYSAFPARIPDGIDALRAHLDEACKRALALADNTFHPDMRYFLQYMEMRRQQCRSLSRLAGSLSRLTPDSRPFPWQAWEIVPGRPGKSGRSSNRRRIPCTSAATLRSCSSSSKSFGIASRRASCPPPGSNLKSGPCCTRPQTPCSICWNSNGISPAP